MANLTSLTLNEALTEAARWLTASECHKAIERCDDLLSAYPDSVRVLNMRARALQACGEIARASQDYARVLEIAPADAQAMTGLMLCQLRLGRVNDAAITAAQLLDHDPANRDAVRLVTRAGTLNPGEPGRVLAAKKKYASGLTYRAIGELRTMLEASADRTDLQAVMAEYTWRDHQRIAATELCQNLLTAEPDCLNAHVLLYELWTRFGATPLAQEHLAALERLDPDHRETCDWLGGASPIGVRDVPAQPPPTPSVKPQSVEEEDREQVEWVNQLAASSMPIVPAPASTPTAAAVTAAVTAAAVTALVDGMRQTGTQAPDVDDEGEVNPAAPLIEWTHADAGEVDAAGGADSGEEPLPPWLVSLQKQAEATTPPAAGASTAQAQTAPTASQGDGASAGPSLPGAVAAGTVAGAVAGEVEREKIAATPVAGAATPPVPEPTVNQGQGEGAAAGSSLPGVAVAGVVAKAVSRAIKPEKAAVTPAVEAATPAAEAATPVAGAATPAAGAATPSVPEPTVNQGQDEGAAAGSSLPGVAVAGVVARAVSRAIKPEKAAVKPAAEAATPVAGAATPSVPESTAGEGEGAAGGPSLLDAAVAGAAAGAGAAAITAAAKAATEADAGGITSESAPGPVPVADEGAAVHAAGFESAGGFGGVAATGEATPFVPLEWAPAEAEVEGMPVAAGVAGGLAAAAAATARSEQKTQAKVNVSVKAPPAAKPAKRSKAKRKRQDLLSLARRSLQTADYDQAAEYYAQLVKSGKQLDALTADLDVATRAYPDVPQFHKLLGEVYARKGDVRAALDSYRRAMELKS